MSFDASLAVKDLIIWIFIGAGLTAYVKLLLARHETALFNPNGELRVVTHEALSRLQSACRENIAKDQGHVNMEITRVSTDSREQMKTIIDLINAQTREIRQLSRCVTLLASGETKPDGC